jgi:YesN/AraC family two-component response regulator
LKGGRVLTAESGQHGLRLLQHQEVNLILVDLLMPGLDGLEVIQGVYTTQPTSKIIAISGGSGQWNYLDAAMYPGANDTLKKPFSLQELLDTVALQLT